MPAVSDREYRLALHAHEEIRRQAARLGPIRTVRPAPSTLSIVQGRIGLPAPVRSTVYGVSRMAHAVIRSIALSPGR